MSWLKRLILVPLGYVRHIIASTRRQIWQARWLIVSLGIAVILLLLSLWMQARSDTVESRYATDRFITDTITANTGITNTVRLHIIYPIKLRLDPQEKVGSPLTISLLDTLPISISSLYTVTIKHDEYLLLTDSEGRNASSQMVFRTNSVSQTIGTVYVRPVPLESGLPLTATLSLFTPSSSPGRPREVFPIDIEPIDESQWRFFLARMLRDIALPLGLAITALGWVFDYRNRQREQVTKERHDYIEAVRKLIDTDLMEAVRGLRLLDNQAKGERWEGAVTIELRDLRNRFASNRQYQGRLLREAGEMIEQGANIDDLLTVAIIFKEKDYEPLVEVFQSAFSTSRPSSSSQRSFNVDVIISAALKLWDEYEEDAREIVVRSIVWAYGQPDGLKSLRAQFQNRGSSSRRLLSDRRLKKIGADLVLYHYQWSPLQVAEQILEDPKISHWLEAKGLALNPFSPLIADLNRLLRWWVEPEHWESIHGPRPTVVLASGMHDRLATAVMLHQTLRTADSQTAFIIWMPLPFADIRSDDPPHNYLRAIARAGGAAWMECLEHKPGALLGLPIPEQTRLVKFLAWVVGSYDALSARLCPPGLSGDSAEEKAMLASRIEAVQEEAQEIAKPSHEELAGCLGIRPPGLRHTYLLALAQERFDGALCRDQALTLLAMADELARLGVIPKLFIFPPLVALLPGVDQVMLTWGTEGLKAILASRVEMASNNAFNELKGLFGPPEDLDEELVEEAEGSLDTLLVLGNRIIQGYISGDLL